MHVRLILFDTFPLRQGILVFSRYITVYSQSKISNANLNADEVVECLSFPRFYQRINQFTDILRQLYPVYVIFP
jgi:hypothetical protein